MTKIGARGAVVGAHAVVGLGPATELGERHDRRRDRPTRGAASAKNASIARVEVGPAGRPWSPAWSVCVSKLPNSVFSTRIPRLALIRRAHNVSCLREVALRQRALVRGLDLLRERHEARFGRADEIAPRAEPGAARRRTIASASYMRRSLRSVRSIPNAPPMSSGSPLARDTATDEMRRDRRADGHAVEPLGRGIRETVDDAARPSGRRRLRRAAPALHPVTHRGEVREVGRLVADAAHDRDLPAVVEMLDVA